MKLSEISRYWAAKELTAIESTAAGVKLRAPFACPGCTVQTSARPNADPVLRAGARATRDS